MLLHTGKAQCRITGKVNDSIGTPIPFAAVGLLNPKDSSVVKGALSNDSGLYIFNKVKPGIYLLKVTATGYTDQYSAPIKADSGKSIIVPVVQLKSPVHYLKALSVVVDKPFMEHKQDRMIFNVENSIISVGKSALEMLNDLPGVSASESGGVSVLGKTGILLLVDGKSLPVDPVNFLKGLDASQIERVEVITNPSAKYQAAGSAVINIILKHDKNIGFNGELNTMPRQGFYLGLTESLTLDYRTKKWNFSLDANTNIFHRAFTHTITRTFNTGTTTEIFDENAPWYIHGTYSFGDIGIDYTPDKKQTFSLNNYFELQFEHLNTYDHTIMHTSTSAIDSSLFTDNIRDYQALHAIPQFTYKYKPDTTDRELSVQIIYGPYKQTDNQQNPVDYYNSAGQELRPPTLSNSTQVLNLNIWALQVDYTQPITSKIKLETGIYEQYGAPDNNAQFWNNINGVQVVDTTKTNQFNFTENIFAGYLNYSQKLTERIDFEAGLRAEQTNDKGVQYVHDTSFTRNYLDFFPSAAFNWKPSDIHAFSLSYTRRIERPGFDQLNPFITVIDPYTYQSGNISLLPDIYDQYQLVYSFKQYLSVTLEHDHYTNAIKQLYFQNTTTDIIYSKPENITAYYGYNAMMNVNIPFAKWWRNVTSVNVYHDDYLEVLSGQNLEITNTSVSVKTLNLFTWKHNWDAELSFSYNSSDLQGLTITQPLYELEAGISKHFFNDRLIIKVSCSDILKSNIQIANTVYQDINVRDYSYNDSQEFSIGITWKFGKSQYHKEQIEQANPFGGSKATKS
jgi:hypothetical protein